MIDEVERSGSSKPDPTPIGDYALLGDGRSCALVSCDGSVDWLCWPRLDSAACFAALLGGPEHGAWSLRPVGTARTTRRYEPGTMVLETLHRTETGTVRVLDFMPTDGDQALARIVEGLAGTVDMRFDLAVRADYGRTVPWVERVGAHERHMVAGPDRLVLHAPIDLSGKDMRTVGGFVVRPGDRLRFALVHGPSHVEPPTGIDVDRALERTHAHWSALTARRTDPPGLPAKWRGPVERSALTLLALTYAPTGGIAAAATTSLPEEIGGSRNWDYRYCWLRDSAFTLQAFLSLGYRDEARAWRDWLVRAIAGTPEQVQIMYGLAGERTLTEWTADWLPGYAGSTPVRIGNAAADQFQLDVYGEVADALALGAAEGLPPHPRADEHRDVILRFLEKAWREPDEGIWEVRGDRRHFVYSKVMAWVAFDRAVRMIEGSSDGPSSSAQHWRSVADGVHAVICEHGFDPDLGSFTQFYGSGTLDASLLLLPLMGFLPVDDPRIVGTVEAVEGHLMRGGLLLRYETEHGHDGLEGEEGAFLLCSFWLVEVYAMQGRLDEAAALFERLLSHSNDLGLMSEEIDVASGHMLGNFPQAFSHVGVVNAAVAITRARSGTGDDRVRTPFTA